jgi:glutathione S-transferase
VVDHFQIDFEFRHIEPDNRPDWFLAISPHKKVPVLRVDDSVSLFESSAIAEYLDEIVSPRLHPNDPIERAVNRAWTDYVPTFAETVTGAAYADSEADYNKAVAKIPVPFERLEQALKKRGNGPLFNGEQYSLVDAAYAPFLQRYFFLDRIKRIGHIEKFPRLNAWVAFSSSFSLMSTSVISMPSCRATASPMVSASSVLPEPSDGGDAAAPAWSG